MFRVFCERYMPQLRVWSSLGSLVAQINEDKEILGLRFWVCSKSGLRRVLVSGPSMDHLLFWDLYLHAHHVGVYGVSGFDNFAAF